MRQTYSSYRGLVVLSHVAVPGSAPCPAKPNRLKMTTLSVAALDAKAPLIYDTFPLHLFNGSNRILVA
jgi:hypothetical protein